MDRMIAMDQPKDLEINHIRAKIRRIECYGNEAEQRLRSTPIQLHVIICHEKGPPDVGGEGDRGSQEASHPATLPDDAPLLFAGEQPVDGACQPPFQKR